MKKLFILILLVASNFMFSQIKFGAKGGLNVSDATLGANFKINQLIQNVTVTDGQQSANTSVSQNTSQPIEQSLYVATSPKIRFYLGGFMEYNINKKGNLAIKTEILYCQNGTIIDKKASTLEEEEAIFYTSQGASYSVGQLNVPVLLKFTTNKKIAFQAGGYFGTILFAKATSNDGLTADLKSRFKTIDLGINLGANYPISKNFALEITYNRGLLNVDKFNDFDRFISAQGLYYNRTFHLGLEYLF